MFWGVVGVAVMTLRFDPGCHGFNSITQYSARDQLYRL